MNIISKDLTCPLCNNKMSFQPMDHWGLHKYSTIYCKCNQYIFIRSNYNYSIPFADNKVLLANYTDDMTIIHTHNNGKISDSIKLDRYIPIVIENNTINIQKLLYKYNIYSTFQ